MRRFTIIIGCCMLLVTLQFIFSCVDSKDRKKISIAYANWAEGIAMTNLAKVILEDQGYRVTLKKCGYRPDLYFCRFGKSGCVHGCMVTGDPCGLYGTIRGPA